MAILTRHCHAIISSETGGGRRNRCPPWITAIVHVYNLETLAYLASGTTGTTTVLAGGNLLVSAEDRTGINLIGGNGALAVSPDGSAGVGGVAEVVVVDKGL